MKIFLIIRADRTCRVAKSTRRLRPDEVAIPLTVRFPPGWGTVLRAQEITLTVPEIPTVEEVA